ncbi:MAG: YceI family protein [Bacteroidia bacterium]|nr:YceI family protein [Bacteroidia bacterium]
MKPITVSLLLLLSALSAAAQQYFVHYETQCFLDGTSNIHNWTATVSGVSGEFWLGKEFVKKTVPAKGMKLEKAVVRFPVKNIDGGRGVTMNDRITEALKEPQYPQILFNMDEGIVTSVEDAVLRTFTLQVRGTLSIAGTSRPVTLDLKAQRLADGRYKFSGQKALKMTDFGIEPPTAMFGQIETGDDLMFRFDLIIYPQA